MAEALVLLNAAQNDAETNHNVPLQRNGAPGRPKYVIDPVQLENMLMLHFKVPEIAMLFRELDAVISDIIQRFPNCGYRLMAGHLRSLNVRVQQQRIRFFPSNCTWKALLYDGMKQLFTGILMETIS